MKKHSNKCQSSGRSVDLCDCDGYHTFDELYEHRCVLYITLCQLFMKSMVGTHAKLDGKLVRRVWRSTTHSDGTVWEGWFILGISYKAGSQITYHIPMTKWNDTSFAQTLDKAPEFDGHTSDDVLERLKFLT